MKIFHGHVFTMNFVAGVKLCQLTQEHTIFFMLIQYLLCTKRGKFLHHLTLFVPIYVNMCYFESQIDFFFDYNFFKFS